MTKPVMCNKVDKECEDMRCMHAKWHKKSAMMCAMPTCGTEHVECVEQDKLDQALGVGHEDTTHS